MDAIIYHLHREEEAKPHKKRMLKVGHLVVIEVPFWESEEFVSGFIGGMQCIFRTSYVFPEKIDTWRDRGYRFAWLCHYYSRKNGMEEYPKIDVFFKRKNI